jgi:hypothetical protein
MLQPSNTIFKKISSEYSSDSEIMTFSTKLKSKPLNDGYIWK